MKPRPEPSMPTLDQQRPSHTDQPKIMVVASKIPRMKSVRALIVDAYPLQRIFGVIDR